MTKNSETDLFRNVYEYSYISSAACPATSWIFTSPSLYSHVDSNGARLCKPDTRRSLTRCCRLRHPTRRWISRNRLRRDDRRALWQRITVDVQGAERYGAASTVGLHRDSDVRVQL